MKLARKVYEKKGEKQADFIGGIAILIGENVLLFVIRLIVLSIVAIASSNSEVVNTVFIIFGIIAMLTNIGTLIYMALTRHWVALGMLTGLTVAFVLVAVCGWLVTSATCSMTSG